MHRRVDLIIYDDYIKEKQMSGLMDNDSNDIDLDESVDGTASAPDFVTPPNGIYVIGIKSIKTSTKTDKDKKTGEPVKKSRASVIMFVAQTKEIAEGEIGVPDGSLFSINYQWTEQGKGFLKAFAEKILSAEAIKNASWKQIFAELEGKQFETRIRIKSDGEYENVNLNDIKPVAA
jgi:hypothetical protein